ncbi:urea ABC transporter permease subunit UrtB [Terrihabitans rhizophilus]|uniref:Urea ABC transporter permease subunit UrtB n=1 Tax=Terrihabitans rhizophilus TaxID=3092662 RepID=A0ABU4RIX8_9HYPH|nr:urea ABC transporter permease subunit UrtB [Terrihabitans sp. PJ23]MDX6804794.1 urea ABC transporter permease subunit UrtB [Terrihabitans sp. PJ23]
MRPLFTLVCCLAALLSAQAASAQAIERSAVVAGLCGTAAAGGEAASHLLALAGTTNAEDVSWSLSLTQAVLNRQLKCPAAGPGVVDDGRAPRDAATLAPAPLPPSARTPVLNLRNRGALDLAQAALTLRAGADAGVRRGALGVLTRRAADVPLPVFEQAAAAETDPSLKAEIENTAAIAALNSPDMAKGLDALERLSATRTRRVQTQIAALRDDPAYAGDRTFKAAVDSALTRVEGGIRIGNMLAALYNGLSFASILFMAAIGLSIIFGLMGVINLAQGELIMIGAYVTWLTQEVLRAALPGLVDYYLLVAIVPAFLVTALIGVALEVTILRHLYRRPLMSLLATWAISLFLINAVRLGFGTQNLQFATPFYVAGGVPVIGDFIVTWNRLFAIAFAAVTLGLTWFVVQRTGLGLDIRAVTQNRDMAGCIGIPTRRVDMLAFGLGSGLAGLAGLSLSPIYNVNPQMGANFIIDAFMVVVLGGVGTIGGTLIAALGVGQINVLIEPFWGAVAAKVIVLFLIIGFLQFRPEGLFSAKGRRR